MIQTANQSNLQSNLSAVNLRIQKACKACNRDTSEIQLLAVSKTKPVEAIIESLEYGQRAYGENYLQEAIGKINYVKHAEIQWHYIGAIQSNKTRAIAENFDWVHTVASEKVLKRLSNQRPATKSPLNLLIQINIDNEPTKAGLNPEDALILIEKAKAFDHIVLRGLMAIPAPGTSTSTNGTNDAFRRLRLLKDQINEQFDLPLFDQLSMGMSSDLEQAVAEGSTILRIGTAIFGARQTQ